MARGPLVISELHEYGARAVRYLRTPRLRREGRSSSPNFMITARGMFVISELHDYVARVVRHLRSLRQRREGRSSSPNFMTKARA
ncbi:hypothetical protein Dimus_026422, partial [Dionaea muscipula]